MYLPWRISAVCAVIVLLAGAGAGAAATPLKAVASIHPLSAIVRAVGGDSIEVTTLVPAGSDPHHYELTPRKAKDLYEADVVFLIGGGFDDWLLPGEGHGLERAAIVRFSEDFRDSLIPIGDTFNPHFWLDPMFAGSMAAITARTLCSTDRGRCSFYTARARHFSVEMDSLNKAISSRLAKAGFKAFVAYHPAWSYFARRYGLDEAGTIELSDEQEPSARHIAGIIKLMKAEGIRIIVAEQFSNTDLAKGVASRTGARIIYLDPLGGDDLPGRNTYVGLLNYDVGVIEKSLEKE
jgi:zinc transport system substrate-binding protein